MPVPTTYGQGYASGYRGYSGGYVPPRMPETNSNAIIAFVLSLVGAFMCPIVPSIIALVLAGKAKKAIDASGGWQIGAGFVTAARIISWVFIVVWGLFVLAYAAFFLLFLILAATTPSSGSTSHLNELSGLVLPWLG